MIVCRLIRGGQRDVELRIAFLIWLTRGSDDPRFLRIVPESPGNLLPAVTHSRSRMAVCGRSEPENLRSGNAEGGSMYRTVFLTWLAAMVIFGADVIYVGWDLVAVAAGLR
jgi:hypothetical protein